MAEVSLAVVGLGYWGPNLARNFDSLPDADLRWICDGSEERLRQVAPRFPGARTARSLDELLADPQLDAVVLATPDPTHASLAARVLEAGKHCFVEKPLAQSEAEGQEAVEAARASRRLLMVGHLLEYHPGLERLSELALAGELGEVLDIYENRLNLGKLREDENALWSLGAHDVSVVLRLAGEEPIDCQAFGESYMRAGVEDVVFCYLRFPPGLAAHLHRSWLDPHKIERRAAAHRVPPLPRAGARRRAAALRWRVRPARRPGAGGASGVPRRARSRRASPPGTHLARTHGGRRSSRIEVNGSR